MAILKPFCKNVTAAVMEVIKDMDCYLSKIPVFPYPFRYVEMQLTKTVHGYNKNNWTQKTWYK